MSQNCLRRAPIALEKSYLGFEQTLSLVRVSCYSFISMFSVGLPFLCAYRAETDKTAHIDGSIKYLGMSEVNHK